MVVVINFDKKILRIVWAYAPKRGRSMSEKNKFYEEMARGRGVENENEVLNCLGDFNERIGNEVDGIEGVHGDFGIGKRNVEDRLLSEFYVDKGRLKCVGNSWFKKDNRKVTFNGGCSEIEKDFVLMKGSQRKFLKDVRAIGGELQHKLLKVVLDGRSHAKKVSHQKVWKLLNEEVKEKFSEKMEVLYQKNDERDVWLKYETSALKAAEEVCGVSKGRPQHGETWWWNQDVQKTITKKRKSFWRWKKLSFGKIYPVMSLIKRKPKKAMKKEAVKEMEKIWNDRNVVLCKIIIMKKKASDLAGNICIKDKNEKVVFAEDGPKRVWKEPMKAIINEENP